MGQESLPSKNAALIDVPEVTNFRASFQYNYWTADEYENGMGSSQAAMRQLPSETFDASFVSRTRRLPRLVRLQWKANSLNQEDNTPNSRVSIREHLDKLHSEQTFTSNDYTTFQYQDTEVDHKLAFFVDQFIQGLTGTEKPRSPMEVVNLVKDNTSNTIQSRFLSEVLTNLEQKGMSFPSDGSAQEGIDLKLGLLEKIKHVSLIARLNNRVLTPITKTVREDSLGIFADEFGAQRFTSQIQRIEETAITNTNANLMNPLDYEFEVLSYVGYRPVDTNGYEPRVQALGYVIEKKEIKADGTEQVYPPLVIENPQTGVTYDGQIRYGSVYYYKIRSVYLVEVHATDNQTRQNILVSFLVGSKFSEDRRVQTVEMIPPPPPADFNIAWDYGNRALRCTWNLPNNPQQDIKYIQLFRRRTIYEPFQLIKMWDFNDTTVRVQLAEYPLPELVERTESFVGMYLDREFTKDSDFIYAVCALDAHGYTSNYSLQFQAKFDKSANALSKKLISVSGAPKQYPNAYLNADTFVDTIKDSGHTRVQVVFNPEYLQLVNGTGADMGLLKTDRVQGKYRFQMINLDLQTQQSVDITLRDVRTTLQANLPFALDPGTFLSTRFGIRR